MGYKKKYANYPVRMMVRCVNNKNCKMLNYGFRGVILQKPTEYLIKFNSGAAHWYSKERFVVLEPVIRTVKLTNELTKTIDAL